MPHQGGECRPQRLYLRRQICLRYGRRRWRQRAVDLDQLFTHSWTLEEAPQAYALFDQQTSGKGVFDPSASLDAKPL
ncbi:MAG: hypothetical protein EBW11_05875 [Betaproteobacteria bacterium]|nr:hypothetical protein [Betaproteobacteria bacterium]